MRSQDSSIASLLSDLKARLQPLSDTPRLDAQVLLAHILDKPRPWLLSHPDEFFTPSQAENLALAASRLVAGEPLPYVIGHWEFYGLDFQVNPHVLIPRPETELLIEHALDWLRTHPKRCWAADIGTGSGCIAVSLAAKLPDLQVLASDISLPALSVAKTNARKHGVVDRIEFIQADLLDFAPAAPFDLICANLPYIPTTSLPTLSITKQEPILAVDGGINGLELIHRMLLQARGCLAVGGLMLLEIEATEGLHVQELVRNIFKDAQVLVYPDLAGHDRLLEIQLSD